MASFSTLFCFLSFFFFFFVHFFNGVQKLEYVSLNIPDKHSDISCILYGGRVSASISEIFAANFHKVLSHPRSLQHLAPRPLCRRPGGHGRRHGRMVDGGMTIQPKRAAVISVSVVYFYLTSVHPRGNLTSSESDPSLLSPC